MTPRKAVELFCDECRHRHLSERTVEANRFFLGRFAHWFELNRACADGGGVADLRDATPEHVLEFHRWLKRKKRPDGQSSTIIYQNRHIRLVKQLFKLLAARNLVMADVGRDFPPLHDPRSLPRGILTPEQVMRLLRQPPLTTPLGFRDRTMLEALYSTGLRGGELCNLSLYDLDLPGRMIRVLQGKGRKDRVVPIGKVAAGYLAEYVKSVRPVLAGEEGSSALFLSATGRALSTNDLHRLIKCYREKARLPDTITTHSLRHTCATEMLKGGASIRHVQELLGHADIMTTQIYTHVVPTDLQKAHARTAPSERRRIADDARFTGGDRPRWNDRRNAPFWRKLHGRAAPAKDRKKSRK